MSIRNTSRSVLIVDGTWVPPDLTPVGDTVISKRVLLEGERCVEPPAPPEALRVVRPNVIRDHYRFKLDVKRGGERLSGPAG